MPGTFDELMAEVCQQTREQTVAKIGEYVQRNAVALARWELKRESERKDTHADTR